MIKKLYYKISKTKASTKDAYQPYGGGAVCALPRFFSRATFPSLIKNDVSARLPNKNSASCDLAL